MFGMGDNPMPVSLNDDSEAISKDWKNVGMYVGSDTATIATAIGAIAAVVGLFTFGKSKQKNK